MNIDFDELNAFLSVAGSGGFREAARAGGTSASSLSEAVRRLETRLGVRLLHRTTRSVRPTEAGARLIERLAPALDGVQAALDVVTGMRDQPTGTLRLTVGARRHQQDMVRAIEANAIRPVIDCDFPLEEIAAAFRHQESGQHFGKICLSI